MSEVTFKVTIDTGSRPTSMIYESEVERALSHVFGTRGSNSAILPCVKAVRCES